MFGAKQKKCDKCSHKNQPDAAFCAQCGRAMGAYDAIGVVVDRSGSMGSVYPNTIEGINSFLVEQQSTPGAGKLFVTQFDSEFEVVVDGAPLDQVEPFKLNEHFQPRGSTALLDAVARTIQLLRSKLQGEPIENVFLMIVTDGHENASAEFSAGSGGFDKVAELIDGCKEDGWHVSFLGADEKGIEQACTGLGIARASTALYANTAQGTEAVYTAMSANVRGVRSKAMHSVAYSDAQRSAMMGDENTSITADDVNVPGNESNH